MLTDTLEIRNSRDVAGLDLTLQFDYTNTAYIGARPIEADTSLVANNGRPGVLRISLTRQTTAADDFAAVSVTLKAIESQAPEQTRLQLITALLSDALGRDMVESTLQRQVVFGGCPARFAINLPLLTR